MTNFSTKLQSDRHLPISTKSSPAAGIYTWVIASDTVFSDSAAADLFGFVETEAAGGQPLQRYLDRIHPEDLPRVRCAIEDAMDTGRPYQEDYRVCRPDGSTVLLTAFGNCFHDASDAPSHYSGIMLAKVTQNAPQTELLHSLLGAYDLANRVGKPSVAETLVEALRELLNEQGEIFEPATSH